MKSEYLKNLLGLNIVKSVYCIGNGCINKYFLPFMNSLHAIFLNKCYRYCRWLGDYQIRKSKRNIIIRLNLLTKTIYNLNKNNVYYNAWAL